MGFIQFFLGYVDPGSGSFLLQALIAGLLGGAYFLKLKWAQMITFFKRSSDQNRDPDES